MRDERVVARFPETARTGVKPLEGGLVHRLDNGTSGALIIARNQAAFEKLRDAIRDGRIAAALRGAGCGISRTADGNRGSDRAPSQKRAKDDGGRSCQLQSEARRPARTNDNRTDSPARGEFTLVSAMPTTGSRHQIRVHLADSGASDSGRHALRRSRDCRPAPWAFLAASVRGRVRFAGGRPRHSDRADSVRSGKSSRLSAAHQLHAHCEHWPAFWPRAAWTGAVTIADEIDLAVRVERRVINTRRGAFGEGIFHTRPNERRRGVGICTVPDALAGRRLFSLGIVRRGYGADPGGVKSWTRATASEDSRRG